MKHNLLGFEDENQYVNHFFETLLDTNKTYEYFVDWEKVKEKVRRHVKEINLLNSLTNIKPEERRSELRNIFTKYPETIPVIPSIIAVREKNISVLEIGEEALYRTFNFSKQKRLILSESGREAEDLADFCQKAGVLELFEEINDLYAYLLGVEVGLDTNARKNRSGTIFQDLVGLLLKRKLRGLDIDITPEDTSLNTRRRKRVDFVVYHENRPRIAIECNFYNTTGSKPIETANSYVDFQKKMRRKEDIIFIWITDGPAWKKMKQTIKQTFPEIDLPMNYTIANDQIREIVSTLV